MRAAVIGATGFVGVPLCQELKRSGWDVSVLARNVESAATALGSDFTIIHWAATEALPPHTFDGIDVIINLAGATINSRWTAKAKDLILNSRVMTTRRIVEAISTLERRPQALINASAVGYYGFHEDEELCEDTSNGADFLASVCKAWEDEAIRAEQLGVRVVRVRTGVVLGDGGALARMLMPYKLFAGGPVGDGRQWFSWIHRDDLIGIIAFAAENRSLSGPVNATAPEPVTMRDFGKALGRAMNRPSWLPVPGIILKSIFGEMSDLLLKGQRVLPCKALEAGYTFKFRNSDEALRDILQ